MAKIGSYIQECVDELFNKVSWPTWYELQNSAILVGIASIIFALVIFVMDYSLGMNSDDALFKGLMGTIYNLF